MDCKGTKMWMYSSQDRIGVRMMDGRWVAGGVDVWDL